MNEMDQTPQAKAAWFETTSGTIDIGLDIEQQREKAKMMNATIHYLYELPKGARVVLSQHGTLLLQMTLRNGSPYELEMPEGKVEVILKHLLQRQAQEPESGIAERAGATVFEMKRLLEAMGQELKVTKVRQGVRAQVLPTKSAEDLGL